MKQVEFAIRAKTVLEPDVQVIGLAVGGSWLTNDMDEFSDLDLILVTSRRISDDKNAMLNYAKRLGELLTGFTGEHVGEPRVLICLYDNPLLHVDIKFLTIDEFYVRVETPVILMDRNEQLQTVLNKTVAKFPAPDFQWIEDRFWIWVHYSLQKIGRGEYFEAFDFFGFLRMVVFGPLLQVRNGKLPRGVRKVETELDEADLKSLRMTIPNYERQSLFDGLRNSVSLYRQLRKSLYDNEVILQTVTEQRVMIYFDEIERQN